MGVCLIDAHLCSLPSSAPSLLREARAGPETQSLSLPICEMGSLGPGVPGARILLGSCRHTGALSDHGRIV